MKHIFYLIVLTLFISSCSKDFNGISPEEYVKQQGLNATELENGVFIVIHEQGNDNKPGLNDVVVTDFRGQVANNGATFANEEDFSIVLGNTLAGWFIGLREIGEGGSCTLIIPPSMAFGSQTIGSIPGKSTVVYEIDLKQVLSTTTVEGYIERNELETIELEKGVHLVILEEGSDKKPTVESEIKVNYVGKYTNEIQFDGGEDVSFILSGLIEGWQIGLPQVGEGGTCMLILPSEVAYGTAGTPTIPPNTPLVFEIELLQVGSDADKYVDENNLNTILLDEGVHIIIHDEGSDVKPSVTDKVNINYKGFLTDDTEFDSGQGVTFLLSTLIRGWQIGIPEIGEGGSCTLIIPPSAGYGAVDQGDIPPNSVLIFDIDLITVE